MNNPLRSPGQHIVATTDLVARRSFMKRMAAALALAGGGMTGCQRAPKGKIVPYAQTKAPETVPGNALVYASVMPLDGYAQGVLVSAREGRPIKVEGNPEHPASLGAAGPFEQAQVLGLYDPDRARAITPATSYPDLVHALTSGPERQERKGGDLAIVLEPTSSLVIAQLLDRLRTQFPAVDVRFFSAMPRASTWNATKRLFGRVLEPRYDLTKADVVVVLDDDPFARGPAWQRWANQFASRRRPGSGPMSRVYVVEPRLTPTGASGDHRLAIRRADIASIAAAILVEIRPRDLPEGVLAKLEGKLRAQTKEHVRFIGAVARDLVKHRGRGVVIVGDAQPIETHILAHAIDLALGNVDVANTKAFAESPILEAGEASHDLAPLAAKLDDAAQSIDTLAMLGEVNLVYASADLSAARIRRARQSFYLGTHFDETAETATWSAPLAHVLETWGDARAFDGTRSIMQPLIAPLYNGRTVAQLLAAFVGEPRDDPYDMTRGVIRGGQAKGAFERAWTEMLVHGVAPATELPVIANLAMQWDAVADALEKTAARGAAGGEVIEIGVDLDRRVHDGRFTNVAWLAELPEPLTSLTWGNALYVSRALAVRLSLRDEQVVIVRETKSGATVRAPVLITHGQAEHHVSLSLGWGRTKRLSVAGGNGVNAYPLRGGTTVTLTPTEESAPLAIVQKEKRLLDDRREEIAGGQPKHERQTAHASLYRHPPSGPQQWGMVIDMNACTGCSACVVACQAENNVPTVGFTNIRKGREMHWLAINIYNEGDARDGQAIRQPMLCQHCEQAPCEYVCPVGATTHSIDGLNEMTYNRCVGTRFCSNNCPYKVRRFNWFNSARSQEVTLVHNPDVTVRDRGVMEKCTYCVQRIRRAEIRTRVNGESHIKDGEIATACEQACPTGAIVFGDIADAQSRVSQLRAGAEANRLHAVLEELNTIPRTRYLKRVTNPNPELA